MNNNKIIKLITTGSLLSSLAAISQTAPIYLPLIGLLLSPISTLPIIIATISSPILGLTCYIVSSFLIFIVSFEEFIIFIFTTGLLGISTGLFIKKLNIITVVISSSIVLTLGIIFLAYFIKLASFIEITKMFDLVYIFILLFIFSLIYTTIWTLITKKILIKYNKIFTHN